MLVIEIALGIVLAVLILSFLQNIIAMILVLIGLALIIGLGFLVGIKLVIFFTLLILIGSWYEKEENEEKVINFFKRIFNRIK